MILKASESLSTQLLILKKLQNFNNFSLFIKIDRKTLITQQKNSFLNLFLNNFILLTLIVLYPEEAIAAPFDGVQLIFPLCQSNVIKYQLIFLP
jgi:hypothetical protein